MRQGTRIEATPKNPTVGRGGCGCFFPEHKERIAKPWRKLKREILGGAIKPFHAADFEQTRPTMRQISGINTFLAPNMAICNDVRCANGAAFGRRCTQGSLSDDD
jgi:hypothetical protein